MNLRALLVGVLCVLAALETIRVVWMERITLTEKQPVRSGQTLLHADASTPSPSNPQATLSPSPHPTTTNLYPLWMPPTPNTSVVGTHGDYEWVYPTLGQGNATAFAQQRFTASERSPCNGSGPCCSIKAFTSSGRDMLGRHMNYMMEFQPIPHRPLFSLVDVLKAWRRRTITTTTTTKRMKLLFIGDSMTTHTYGAAVCELARNEALEWMTYSAQPIPQGKPVGYTFMYESHVKLKGDDVDYELLHIRQDKWTSKARVLETFLRGADAIVFGLGLHYAEAHKNPDYLASPLKSLVHAIRATHEPPEVRNRTLVWLGDPKQHFRLDYVDGQVSGIHTRSSRIHFCGPVARFPPGHPGHARSISSIVYQHFTNTSLLLSSSWFKWNDEHRPPLSSLHMHFLPFHDLTAPFFENNFHYYRDPTTYAVDCTHFFGLPNFYESMWDALYLLVADAAWSIDERFPAGGQQFLDLVPYNGTLDYDNITKEIEKKQ